MLREEAIRLYRELMKDLREAAATGLDMSPGDSLAGRALVALETVIDSLPNKDTVEPLVLPAFADVFPFTPLRYEAELGRSASESRRTHTAQLVRRVGCPPIRLSARRVCESSRRPDT